MKTGIFCLLFAMIAFSSFGQENTLEKDDFPVIVSEISGNMLIFQNKEHIRRKQDGAFRNNVYIQQLGDRNLAVTNISSEEGTVDLLQDGNGNYINVTANVKSINEVVVQQGNNNFLLDFIDNPSQETSLNLIQNGNNIHFARYGSNSIGNNLKFKITGDSKAVIIRNFK